MDPHMDSAPRHHGSLPSIQTGFPDAGWLKREEAEIQAAHTMIHMTPRTTEESFSGPPPSYSQATAPPTTSTSTAYGSPPETRRGTQDSKDGEPPRQSLPSISEALAHSPPQVYHAPRSPSPRSPAEPSPKSKPHHAPNGVAEVSKPEAEQRFFYERPSISYESRRYQSSAAPQPTYGPINTSPASPHFKPANASQWSAVPPRPTTQYQTAPPDRSPPWVHPSSARYGPAASPPRFNQQPPPQQHSAPGYPTGSRQTGYVTSYPALAVSTSSERFLQWPHDPRDRDSKDGNPAKSHHYGESVKRHLENFDTDQALNDVFSASQSLSDFSGAYRRRAHQNQRSGPTADSQPDMNDIREAMRQNDKIHACLSSVLEKLQAQEAERIERSAREEAEKQAVPSRVKDLQNSSDTSGGGFAGSDPKKRRGRTAPPGRCHSCNRAETPEWRRGPDGARTLCNACGLHYAKLTRKMGANKAAAGGSNLRPKELGPG